MMELRKKKQRRGSQCLKRRCVHRTAPRHGENVCRTTDVCSWRVVVRTSTCFRVFTTQHPETPTRSPFTTNTLFLPVFGNKPEKRRRLARRTPTDWSALRFVFQEARVTPVRAMRKIRCSLLSFIILPSKSVKSSISHSKTNRTARVYPGSALK